MKKLTFLLIIFSWLSLPALAQKFDQIISTYSGHNALVNVQKSNFDSNQFTITLNFTWVNNKLKPTKIKHPDLLAVDLKNIKILPKNSVIPLAKTPYSAFSDKQTSVTFGLNPNFGGGNVYITLPLVSAPDLKAVNTNNITPIFFAHPKKLEISYFIDSTKILDIYPPEISVTYPVINKNVNPDFPVVNKRLINIYLSVFDKGGVKLVTVNGKPAKQNFPGEYTAPVILSTGLNTIKIKAQDFAGNTSTLNYNIVCTYQYDIKLNGGKFYALLIAENDYKDPNIPDLSHPISDATSLMNVLTKYYIFDPKNIIFLKNPTRAQIIKTFNNLSQTLTDKDNLIIFYAGHGYWDDYTQIGYWLPADAKINDYSTWLRNSTVKDYIGAIHSKHTLLITDACFSGSIFKTRGILRASYVIAYQKLYELPSRKAMTSGTLKEVPDKSIFLHALVLQLKTNKDKYLPASKLFQLVRVAVLNNTPNVPQYGTIQDVGDEGGEFIFIRKEQQ